MSTKTEGPAAATIGRTEAPVSKDTLTITDNRTGKTYEVPIQDGTIKAIDLRQIKVAADDFGLMTYDPGYMNTASCKSRITFIDGDKGILNYRGYPIEELAEQSNYLETAYLLLNGELPTKAEYDGWVDKVTTHTFVHENVKELMAGFRYDAHPMGMLASTVAALSTFYPDAKKIRDAQERSRHVYRLIAKIPTLAAFAYRHSMGLPVRLPGQRAELHGQLPADDVQDERAQVQGEPGPREGARGPLHPARRPRAELLDVGDAQHRLVRGRPLLRGGRRHRRPLRPAARRRERGRPADAPGDRLEGQGRRRS